MTAQHSDKVVSEWLRAGDNYVTRSFINYAPQKKYYSLQALKLCVGLGLFHGFVTVKFSGVVSFVFIVCILLRKYI
jgi:hypothetical protein